MFWLIHDDYLEIRGMSCHYTDSYLDTSHVPSKKGLNLKS